MIAEIDGQKIRVWDLTAEEWPRANDLPGARGRQKQGEVKLPLTWAACVQLRQEFGTNLSTIMPDLEQWAWRQRSDHIQPATSIREALELPARHPARQAIEAVEANSPLRLKPFQAVDVAFLLAAEQAVLAQPPGSGKTAVLIRTLQVLDYLGKHPLPVIIICPNSLKTTVWAREIERWWPEVRHEVAVIDAGTQPLAKRRAILASRPGITVINWEALRLHSRVAGYGGKKLSATEKQIKELDFLCPRTVIADEAHRLRNPADSQQARAAWSCFHNAEYRYAATGTPIDRDMVDLWGLLHAVKPDWFPSKTKYIERYADVRYDWFGGIESAELKPGREKEFRAITSPIVRRLPKEAILPQLPPKLPPEYRETPMSGPQAKLYGQMETDFLAWTDSGQMITAPSALAQLTRLLQLASANATVDDEGHVRLTEPSPKVNELLEILADMGDEPLVVYAVSRQLLELASARLTKAHIAHGMITGAQSIGQRDVATARFQSGDYRVILINSAGSEGITLTRANTICFMQRSWSPKENEQATDRVHRIGSEIHDHVRIIIMEAPDTVEQRVRDALEVKGGRIERVIQDKAVLRRLAGA